MEKSRRLAVYAFATGKQQEKEARTTASKALKLPASVRFFEDEDDTGKDLAFDAEMVQRIEKARYDQQVLRAAINNRRGFGYGRGRGGRGRGDRGGFSGYRQNNFFGKGNKQSTFQTNTAAPPDTNHQ